MKPSTDRGPFHEGEQAIQARTGVRDQLESVGRRIIRDSMPDQHRELFGKLPWLHVGSVDVTGQPWASLVAGPPGFVSSPDERTLLVAGRPLPGDPLAQSLTVGQRVGLLGLEPSTRRRNRANGRVISVDRTSFAVHVEQSFGNCPKYIHARALEFVAGAPRPSAVATALTAALNEEARLLLGCTDTLFLATAHAQAADGRVHDPSRGVDISHRGGRPGFVRVRRVGPLGDVVLDLPDFVGNFMFQSLGNLATEPRAGMLAVDLTNGDVVSLIGEAEVFWDGPEREAFPGAERVMRLRVTRGVWLPGAAALRGTLGTAARELTAIGTWRHPQFDGWVTSLKG